MTPMPPASRTRLSGVRRQRKEIVRPAQQDRVAFLDGVAERRRAAAPVQFALHAQEIADAARSAHCRARIGGSCRRS